MNTRVATAPKRGRANGLPALRRFTVDEYYRMAEAGILGPDERVELIDGEIFCMAPMLRPHAARVTWLAHWLTLKLIDRALVRVQLPIHLTPTSEPEPDLAVVGPRDDFYATAHPVPADVLLITEVADTSLAYDRRKLRSYAAAGIPEVWIDDIRRRRTLVHRDPSPEGYRQIDTVGRGGTLSPLAFPDLVLPIDEVFPR